MRRFNAILEVLKEAGMLTIPGPRSRFCDGMSRRSWLQIGSLAMGGMALPQILRGEAKAGAGTADKLFLAH